MNINIQSIGRKLFIIIAILFFGITFSGCKREDKKIEVSFIKTSYEITVDEEVDVLLRLKNVKKENLVFEAEDTKIATLTNGKLKGIAVGQTVISVMVKDMPTTRVEIFVNVIEKPAVEYTITYFLNGGTNSPLNPSKYSQSDLPLTINEPTREHYTFGGWYVNAGFITDPVTEIKAENTGDIRLYALWLPTEYTITYVVPENTTNNNITKYTILDLPVKLNNPNLNGYAFKGWFMDEEFSQEITEITNEEIDDLTLYAKFEKLYNVTYNLNGGNLAADALKQFSKSDLGTDLPIPTKEGYEFVGWYDNPNFTNEAITKLTTGEDLVLFAKWSGGESEYEIDYKLNGGLLTEGTVKTYRDGETIVLPIPTLDGAVFIGWYLDANFETFKVTEITAGTGGKITLYACWEFEITFKVDDEETTEKIYYGQKLIQPEDPVKEGFTFTGWYVVEGDEEVKFNFDLPVTRSVTLIAKFLGEETTE